MFSIFTLSWVTSPELFCSAELALYLHQTRLPAPRQPWPLLTPVLWLFLGIWLVSVDHLPALVSRAWLPSHFPDTPQFTRVAACDSASSFKGEWFCSCIPIHLSEDLWLLMSLGSCEQHCYEQCRQVSAFSSFRYTPWNGSESFFTCLFFPSELKLHVEWSGTSTPPHLRGWRSMNQMCVFDFSVLPEARAFVKMGISLPFYKCSLVLSTLLYGCG